MLLIEWVEVSKFIYATVCLIPTFVLFLKARGRKDKLLPLLSLIPALIFCLLFVLWGVAVGGANDGLPAVYSSDGRFAARVSIGPFGAQAVELFSWYGLRKDVLYRGDTDDERNLRWIGDRTLKIPVRGSSEGCMSTSEIEALCASTRR